MKWYHKPPKHGGLGGHWLLHTSCCSLELQVCLPTHDAEESKKTVCAAFAAYGFFLCQFFSTDNGWMEPLKNKSMKIFPTMIFTSRKTISGIFLFFTGYMKKVSERQDPDTPEKLSMTMKIPNIEIRSIYNNQIRMWFEKQIQREDRSLFYQAVLNGDTAGIEKTVSHLLEKSISVFDSSEAFYHGFFISLLSNLPNYALRSNREEGSGRPDIVLYPVRYRDPAIIFEIKRRKKYNDMESGLEEAFAQIKNEQYEEDILNDGCLSVKSYAICFCKKSCIVGAMNKTHST